MGNKSTREIREKIEQYNEDVEKKELDWEILSQEEVYDQMCVLTRYFLLQKLQIHFVDPKISDISPLKDAIQGSEIFEVLKVQAQNTQIEDGNILPSHINTLNRFYFDASNTNVNNLSELFQVLNQNILLEYVYLNLNNTKLQSIKLFDIHLLQKLKSLTLFLKNTQIENVEELCMNLAKLPILEELHLDFSGTKVQDLAPLGSALKSLKKLIQLTIKVDKLNLENVFELASGVGHCSNLIQLTLTFNDSNISEVDKFGEVLKHLPNLEYFNFQFSNTAVNQAADLFTKIGYVTSLKSLSLNYKNTTVNSLLLSRTFDTLQKLEHIRISANQQFDQTILEAISTQQQLKSLLLDLSNTNVNSINQLLDQIADLRLLRHLQLLLPNTQISELNCSNFSKLQNLRTLQIDLSNTPLIKLIGLENELGQIRFLNYFDLDLRGTKFEQTYMEKIKEELKKLQYLKEFHLQ